jgi:hypothetical protein
MDTWSAFAMGQANKGKPLKVFDWDKAAALIRERKPEEASAGLAGDWEYTGGTIYRDGKPVPKEDTYTYLASTWATPQLDMDGDVVACYRMEDEVPQEWGESGKLYAGVYWPKSALAVLAGELPEAIVINEGEKNDFETGAPGVG